MAVELNEVPAVFHRPHPRPTVDQGTVKSVRDFFEKANIGPNA